METELLVDGLCFGEGPRWHDGQLWFSDMHANRVCRLKDDHTVETVLELGDDQPSGLGWLPDGQLLIVSMQKRQLLVSDGSSVGVMADLSDLAKYHCNDMVTDSSGRSYIGNFGFDLHKREEMRPAELILVDPDGTSRVVAEDMMFPNGCVITPDGSTLIVGESFGARLTAFSINRDGSLADRRVWATLENGAVPDGICLDDANGVWVASPTTNEVLRVQEGGAVTHHIPTDRAAIACMLGGEDGKTLYILTSRSSDPEVCQSEKMAQILACQVPYSGAGLP